MLQDQNKENQYTKLDPCMIIELLHNYYNGSDEFFVADSSKICPVHKK